MADDLQGSLHPESEQHRTLMRLCEDCFNLSERYISQRYERWEQSEKMEQAYIDVTATDNKGRKKNPFDTTVYIPITRAIKDTILTYFMGVFTRKRPVITINGRGPEDVAPAKRIEVVIDYQLERQRIQTVLWSFLSDVLKFSLGHIKAPWTRQEETFYEAGRRLKMFPFPHYSSYEEERRVVSYEGPALSNTDPFFLFTDPRVSSANFNSGQFVIYEYERTWHYLKKRERDGIYFNLDWLEKDWASHKGNNADNATFRVNRTTRNSIIGVTMPAGAGEVLDVDERNPTFTIRENYIELIPQKYGLGEGSYPEIWVITTVGNRAIIRCERSVYGEDFPCVQAQFDFDPHAMFTQSFYEGMVGMQDLLNWLYNSHMDNTRRFLNDTLVFNQLAVDAKSLTQRGPAKAIKLTKAFAQRALEKGIPIDAVIKQLQVADVTGTHIRDAEGLIDLMERRAHTPDTVQGLEAEVKRTATEIARMTNSSHNILGQIATLIYAQAFIPLGEHLVKCNQRFLEESRYYRILGDYAREILVPDIAYQGGAAIRAGREDIQGFFDFPVSDGRMPVTPEEQSEMWLKAIEIMHKSPIIMQAYDVAAVFREFVRSMGIKNIDDFRVKAQVVENPMLDSMAQAGNVIPLAEYINGGQNGGFSQLNP